MSTISDKDIKARKQHVCFFCELPINKGEIYNREVSTDCGKAWTCKAHLHCIELIGDLDMDCYGDGINSYDFKAEINQRYERAVNKKEQTESFEERLLFVRQMCDKHKKENK